MTDLSDLAVFTFGYFAILACFFIMAINVFLAVLEYYVFAALAGIFLPFGLLEPTKFLAEKAIGAVVSASVKLMVLALVTAVIDPVLSSIHFAGPEITFNELWSVFLTVCALMFLCWKAPSLAASLLGGSPHLGVDHIAQAMAIPLAAGLARGKGEGRAAVGASALRAAASAPQGVGAAASSIASAASTLGGRAGGAASGESSATGPKSAGAPPAADPSLVLSAMGRSSPPAGPAPTTGA
jgi:type IV secretion system protein TrbL